MKIGILHQDLEDSEKKFQDIFSKYYGIETRLFQIGSNSVEDIFQFKPDLVLNRVYASVANRNCNDVKQTLKLLQILEFANVFCINSHMTSLYDYSKYDAAKKMDTEGIPTPETMLIKNNNFKDLKTFIEKHNFPLIIKRNMGGRGKDVERALNLNQLKSIFDEFNRYARKENYSGGFIIQEYIRSVDDSDRRITVVDGEITMAIKRKLIPYKSEDAWLASVSLGSSHEIYEPTKDEKYIAKGATKAIDSQFNSLDIILSEKGPVIIENNPTPSFTSIAAKSKIEETAKLILNTYEKNTYGLQ